MTSNELAPASNGWATMTESLRSRFPKATDGILFCIYKLEQDPTLTIPDFRDEAKLHGIALGGRALHSAKVLLGLADAPPRRKRAAAKPAMETPRKSASRRTKADSSSLQDQVLRAITEIQASATDQTRKLRDAMREAVRILEEALDED